MTRMAAVSRVLLLSIRSRESDVRGAKGALFRDAVVLPILETFGDSEDVVTIVIFIAYGLLDTMSVIGNHNLIKVIVATITIALADDGTRSMSWKSKPLGLKHQANLRALEEVIETCINGFQEVKPAGRGSILDLIMYSKGTDEVIRG